MNYQIQDELSLLQDELSDTGWIITDTGWIIFAAGWILSMINYPHILENFNKMKSEEELSVKID